MIRDLLEHASQAGASRVDLTAALSRALALGRFDGDRLRDMARRFGTKRTQDMVASALAPANP